MDRAYERAHYALSELPHRYGENVHIVADPLSLTQLAALCHKDTGQPRFNELVARLYTRLLDVVINHEFPRRTRTVPTRMHSTTSRAVVGGELLDTDVEVVTVAVVRAGVLPSQVCYDACNALFDSGSIRQDYLLVSRVAGDDGHVARAEISGAKVGGSVDGRIVLVPDPMGATGKSVSRVIDHYREHHEGEGARFIVMSLIVTPQFVRNLSAAQPGVSIYALRLDRGMSPPEVLRTALGERAEEDGLTSSDYIVPGGGGFGELMTNSWV